MKKLLILILVLLASTASAYDWCMEFSQADTAEWIHKYGSSVDTMALVDTASFCTTLTGMTAGLHQFEIRIWYDTTKEDWVSSTNDYWVQAGDGQYTDTIFVLTSGGTAVSGAKISWTNLSGALLSYQNTTGTNGRAIFSVPGDSIIFSGWVGGYNIETDTVIKTASGRDTLTATAWSVSPPSSANLCRAYAFVRDIEGNWLNNAKLEITLNSQTATDTCSDVIIGRHKATGFSNDTGYVYVDVAKTSCLNVDTYYTWKLYFPGGNVKREGTMVTDTNSTYQLAE